MWPVDAGPTKRELGLLYVGGTGLVFTGVLLGRLVVTGNASLLGTLLGLVPAVSLASAGWWLDRTGLDDEQVWSVAKWAALGIGLLTLLNTGVVLLDASEGLFLDLEMGLFMSNVTAGAVAGLLVGALWEFNKTTRRLSQRNLVLNRVLRHNIRNDVNVILGHAELLEAELGAANGRIDAIKDKGHAIVGLTEKARLVERVFDREGRQLRPVDVVPIVERRVEALREATPSVAIDSKLPDEAWVWADTLLETLLDNLLENAVEHNEGPPEIGVSVATEDGEVVIRITDNGPPIPESELTVLDAGRETALHHGSGLGLWLVYWLVESYDGTLAFDRVPDGNLVRVRLRRAAGVGSPAASTAAAGDGV